MRAFVQTPRRLPAPYGQGVLDGGAMLRPQPSHIRGYAYPSH
jgi:hypothetical protein